MERVVLKFLAWIGTWAQGRLKRLEQRALRPGTLVKIVGCPCGRDHSGTWRVDFVTKLGDYRLVRTDDGETTIADGGVLEIQEAKSHAESQSTTAA